MVSGSVFHENVVIVFGICMGSLMLKTVIMQITLKRGYPGKESGTGRGWLLKQCWKAKWALFLPFLILGGNYGVVMTMNLCLGMITPPVGVNLYVAQGISKAPFESLIREALPMMFALLIAIGLTVAFPQLALFLPRLLGQVM